MMIESLTEDVRYALRALHRARGYVVIAILSLALGIGANTAIFTVVDAVFLRALPVEDPDELVMVWENEVGVEPRWTVSPGNFVDFRDGQTTFEELTAFNIYSAGISDADGAERITGSIVLPNFFDVLGVRPVLGRGFRPEDGEAGAEPVIVISYAMWQGRFGGDRDVVGRTVRLWGAPYTIVGVMPRDLVHPEREARWARPLFWRPIVLEEQGMARQFRWMRVMGRLRDDATLGEARMELEAIATRLAEAYPATNEGWSVTLVPLHDELFGSARGGLRLLLLGAGFVLLIVAVNVANLMLARSQRRSREFAVRAALGAGRMRLARQVLVEALVIALLGGLAGTLLVWLAGDVLQAVQAEHLAGAARIRIDARVIAFMFGVSALSAIAFGLWPALRSARPDLRAALAGGRTVGDRSAHRSRRLLIIAELALTVVLLISAALLGRSFLRLTSTEIGFEADEVLSMQIALPSNVVAERERVPDVQDQILARIASVPGVEAVALATDLPFTASNHYLRFVPQDIGLPGEQQPAIEYRTISPGYFRVMGLRTVAGEARAVPAERAGGVARIVINQSLADRFWPGADPLGRRVRVGSSPVIEATVGGVVSDILDDGFQSSAEPRFYTSHHTSITGSPSLLIRTAVEPLSVAPAVRAEIAAFDAEIPISDVHGLADVVSATVSGRRIVLLLVLAFAGLTLALAAVGIYGVLSYDVSQRTREVGLRIALGARAGDVVRLVLRDSLSMAGVGLVLGVGLGLATTRVLRGMLVGVGPGDPVSIAVVVLTLGGTAVLAALLPARRAARIQPMEALREE